jgi:2-polyprenyl-3-methyl-5-hydroxy-6-metoxy-1,4-benzoquinol methylase
VELTWRSTPLKCLAPVPHRARRQNPDEAALDMRAIRTGARCTEAFGHTCVQCAIMILTLAPKSLTQQHLLAAVNTELSSRDGRDSVRVLDVGCGEGHLVAFLQAG